jgi:hypothetical protein
VIIIKSKNGPVTVTRTQLKAIYRSTTKLDRDTMMKADLVTCNDDMTRLRYRIDGEWTEMKLVLPS